MAIDLTKGQRVDIGLHKIGVGLGWDPNEGSTEKYDLDLSAFLLGSGGKVPTEAHFVFFNNLHSPDGSVEGAVDDRTGESSDGDDDETIKVDLTKVSQQVQEIILVASIHEHDINRQNFGQIRNSYIRIYDELSKEEIAKYELDEDFSVETAVEFGRLYRREGAWKFEAIGRGVQGGLETLVGKYT